MHLKSNFHTFFMHNSIKSNQHTKQLYGNLPNQRRSGTIRVLGSFLDCKSCFKILPLLSRKGLFLYILRRRTVAAVRVEVLLLPLLRFVSSECFGLPETFTLFSFFFAIFFFLLFSSSSKGQTTIVRERTTEVKESVFAGVF